MENKNKKGIKFLAATLAIATTALFSCEKPIEIKDKEGTIDANPYSATINSLVMKDALGRAFGEQEVTNSHKKVGIFYHIWHGYHTPYHIYNITEMMDKCPDFLWNPKSTKIAPNSAMYYWDEPLYGYYSSDDPWIIMRHLELFTMSGIDYLALDLSNLLIYKSTLESVLNKILDLQEQGWNPPKIMCYFGENPACLKNIQKFYDLFCKDKKYERAFYRKNKEGKPVIAVDIDGKGASGPTIHQLSDEAQNYFDFRNAVFPYHILNNDPSDFDMPWIDWVYPQRCTSEGYMSVSLSQHPSYAFSHSVNPEFYGSMYNANRGRGWNYQTKKNDRSKAREGLNLQNQWRTALTNDKCDEVMVTGWNEWIAQKLVNDYQGDEYPNIVKFADLCNYEFSRDMEMVAREGAYGDSHYLLNMKNTREFKNKEDVIYVAKTGTPSKDFDDKAWDEGRTYKDFVGDAMERNHRGSVPSEGLDIYGEANDYKIYSNKTNRNDIVETKVINDDSFIYFKIKTKESIIIDSEKSNNLNILFSIKENGMPSWNGYNFVVNRKASNDPNGLCSLEKVNKSDAYYFEKVSDVSSSVQKDTIVIKIPLKDIGIQRNDKFTIDFKITDGISDPSNIMNYYCDGDCAPIGRLNYRYHAGKKK